MVGAVPPQTWGVEREAEEIMLINDNQVLFPTQHSKSLLYYDLTKHEVSAPGCLLGNRSWDFHPCSLYPKSCVLFPPNALSIS